MSSLFLVKWTMGYFESVSWNMIHWVPVLYGTWKEIGFDEPRCPTSAHENKISAVNHIKLLHPISTRIYNFDSMLTLWSENALRVNSLKQSDVSKLTNIGSDNCLSPGRRQAIIWTNDGLLLIGPLGTNFSRFLIVIYTFSFSKMHLKISFGK